MPASIGVNLRVTGHCRQGGRKYMEDFFSVAYQQTQDEKDLEYAFFGIFDGHGGMEAATFAKEHLMESIVRQKNFWSDKDEDVLKAIKEGYINTHYAMWREQEKWPKTASGLPSTAGTTASVAFIRRGKIYIGHVGDSGIILGYQEPGNPIWQAKQLTEDHKPENKSEMSRIKQCGGKVITKSGVPRVVWNRPRIGHKGPVRRSTPIDEIPFLAVARSLGDLWSYNSALDEFVVSPDPDTICIPIDSDTFRCLIFGTDGLWNMISATSAVNIVQVAEQHNEKTVLAATDSQDNSAASPGRSSKVWINPSKCLVERALERWSNTRMRADNTSVITLMLDPPGPPRAEVIKNQRLLENRQRQQQLLQQTQEAVNSIQNGTDDQFNATPPDYPETGLEILTMYEDPQITNNFTENINFIDTNDDIVKPESQQYLRPEPCSSGIQQTSIDYSNTVQIKNDEIISETVTNIEKIEQQSIVTKQAEQIKTRRLTEENLDKIHQQVLKDMETEKENQNVESILQVTNSVNNFYETNCSTSSVTTENSTKTIYSQIDACSTTRLKGNAQKTDQKFIEKQPDKDKTQKESKKLINKGGNKTQDENVSSLESREVNNDELKQQKLKEEEFNEKIQINEVSSSSPDKFTNDDLKLVPCSRCTRSQDSTITNIQTKITKIQNRKSLRINTNKTLSTSANKQIVTSKILATSSGKQKITKISSRSNSTSPLPRRKTRASVIKTPGINSQNKRTFSAAKREHSDSDIRGVAPADSTRYQANNTVEPPQKLRRSQSLGPRDFALRSMSQLKTERCLRDRNGTNLGSLGRNSLANLAAGSSNSFKKISSVGKNFTPVKQAIQTRNRVKRLNK